VNEVSDFTEDNDTMITPDIDGTKCVSEFLRRHDAEKDLQGSTFFVFRWR